MIYLKKNSIHSENFILDDYHNQSLLYIYIYVYIIYYIQYISIYLY